MFLIFSANPQVFSSTKMVIISFKGTHLSTHKVRKQAAQVGNYHIIGLQLYR